MTRARLAFALCISVALISGATWTRIANAERPTYELLAVKNGSGGNTISLAEYMLDEGLQPGSANVSLNNTDLVSRQMILDYVDLATSGRATEQSLIALAESYVDKIPSLNSAPTMRASDLKVVEGSKSNFQNYADDFTKIHRLYGERISKAAKGGKNINTLNPTMYAFAETFGMAYDEAAQSLKKLSVPEELVEAHLKLVNKYLASASAMRAISKTEADAATSFAGLIALQSNLNEEEMLMAEITRIVNSHGI